MLRCFSCVFWCCEILLLAVKLCGCFVDQLIYLRTILGLIISLVIYECFGIWANNYPFNIASVGEMVQDVVSWKKFLLSDNPEIHFRWSLLRESFPILLRCGYCVCTMKSVVSWVHKNLAVLDSWCWYLELKILVDFRNLLCQLKLDNIISRIYSYAFKFW